MGLFDNIEKVINEHGSSTILRERLQLAADKYDALERKAAGLSSEVETLTSERNQLRLALEKAEKENQTLREPANSSGAHPEECLKILAFLANAPESSTPDRFLPSLRVSPGKGQHFLDLLKEGKLIDASYRIGFEPKYYCTAKGRSYLVQLGRL